MTALSVNLRQYYQRWGLYYWYFILTCVMVPQALMAIKGKSPGHCLACLLLSVLMGIAVGSSQRGVMSRPFSYCLPGQMRVMQKVIMIFALVVNLLGAQIFWFHSGLDIFGRGLAVLGAFGLGMVIYTLSVWASWAGRSDKSPMFGLTPLLVFGLLYFDGHLLLLNVIVESWYICLGLGIVSGAWLWRLTGDLEAARRDCGRSIAGILDGMNMERGRRIQQRVRAEKWAKNKRVENVRVENFFLGRMGHAANLSLTRVMWGAIYEILMPWFSQETVKFAVLALLLAVGYGYFPWGKIDSSQSMVNFLYVMVMGLGFQVSMPVWHSFLLASGRRQRFWATLSGTAGFAVMVTILAAAVAGTTVLLEKVLPAVIIKGQEINFSAMDLRLVYVSTMVMAVGFSVKAIARKNGLLMMLIFTPVIVTGFFWVQVLGSLGVIWGLLIMTAVWLIYIAILWLRCFRWRLS